MSVSNDRAAAENVLKEKIAYYGHAMSPLVLDRLGLTLDDFKPIEQAVMVENDLEKAKLSKYFNELRFKQTPDDKLSYIENLDRSQRPSA